PPDLAPGGPRPQPSALKKDSMNMNAQADAAYHRSRGRPGVMYARVSSKEQDREGFSIPAQLKLLRGYAEVSAIALTREFTDVETAKESGRAGFNEMSKF